MNIGNLSFVEASPIFSAVLCTVSLATLSCEPCDMRGCEAIELPAEATIPQGVAGAVAYQSDLVEFGCHACPLSATTIAVWPIDEPVLDDATAEAVVKGSDPAYSVLAEGGRYELPLPTGDYLLCDTKWYVYYCVAIPIIEEGVITVNIHEVYGPTGMTVFEPGATSPTEMTVFEVNMDEI